MQAVKHGNNYVPAILKLFKDSWMWYLRGCKSKGWEVGHSQIAGQVANVRTIHRRERTPIRNLGQAAVIAGTPLGGKSPAKTLAKRYKRIKEYERLARGILGMSIDKWNKRLRRKVEVRSSNA